MSDLLNIGGRDYHVTLEDRNGTKVGLVLVNSAGNDDALAIEQSNHPRTPLQTSQGQGEHSDLLPPYKELVQQDHSGGRASKLFRKDQTRYMDAGNVNTELEEQVILRGAPSFSSGVRAALNQSVPGDVLWSGIQGDGLYRSVEFTADGNIGSGDAQVMVWVRRKSGCNNNLLVSVCPDSGGDPDYSSALGEASVQARLSEPGHAEAVIVFDFCTGITASTKYHIVITGTDHATEHWEIATISGSGGKKSSDGSSWSAGPAPYYRVYDDSNVPDGEFYEYKGALYWVEFPKASGSNSRILINGDRGAADSNSGALTTLVDATKSWTNDEFAGAVVVIVAGPGSDERQQWREISSNNATTLTVSPSWNITHTTDTEYVIINADTWRLHTTLSSHSVRDVEVAGDNVYFIERGTRYVYRYNERNVAGTWTVSSFTQETILADIMRTVYDPDNGTALWFGYNDDDAYGKVVFKADIAKTYSPHGLSERVAVIDQVDRPWDEQDTGSPVLTEEIDQGSLNITIGSGHSTGILATKALTEPLDVRQGEGVGFIIESNVAASASDLSFLLDDTPYCGKKYIPDYFLQKSTAGWPELYMYDDSETGDDQWKKQGNAELRRTGTTKYQVNFTLTADDKIYIGYRYRFSHLMWDIDTAQTNAQTMSIKYWDGEAWSALSITDDTVSGGATLAQDDDMYWDPTAYHDWNPGTHGDQASYLDQDLYWVELTPSGALTVVEGQVTVRNSEDFSIGGYIDLTRAKNGDDHNHEVVTLRSDDFLYIGADFRFERIYVDMDATVNAVTATLAAEYFNGATWETITVTSNGTDPSGDQTGATFAQDGTIVLDIQHFDWAKATINNAEAYWIRLQPSANLTPYIRIVDIAVESDNAETLNLPALVAGEPTWVNLTIGFTPRANPEPDLSNVVSIGLKLNTDLGSNTIRIYGPVYLTRTPQKIQIGNGNELITGLGAHGDERTNLIVHTVNNAYEVQSQNDNLVVEWPIDELRTVRSVINGRANTHNDVYHYFNLHTYVQRYVDGSLENVGPDRDEGLPEERNGIPELLLSTPAGIILVTNPIDYGPGNNSYEVGIATLHARRGGGWHEIYRAPRKLDSDSGRWYSARIHSVIYQSSYTGVGRLWICQDGDLFWVPFVLDNPLNHASFTYVPNGYLITGWFDANFVDIEKTFTHLKVASENLSDGAITIRAFYQLDSGELLDPSDDSNWTEISDVFDTSTSQRIELSTSTDVTAKRIRFKLILDTNDETVTPVLVATVLQLIFFNPVKEVFNTRYRSNDVAVSVDGQPDFTSTAVVFDATIKDWATPPANQLTLGCLHPSFNGKTVVVQYPAGKPFESDPEGGPERESLIRELVLMEV